MSFSEDDLLDVYDISDPDWALVGIAGSFGFAPVNYLEKVGGASTAAAAAPPPPAPPAVTPAAAPAAKKHVAFTQDDDEEYDDTPAPVRRSPPPAAEEYSPPARVYSPAPASPALPDRRSSPALRQTATSSRSSVASPASSTFRPGSTYDSRPPANRAGKTGAPAVSPPTPHFQDSDDDSDGPGLPLRVPGANRGTPNRGHDSDSIPPGFRIYSVNEVDSKKKRAAVLGLGPNRIILLPDKSTRPREEWTVDNMTGYNHEGKHVFVDLKHPTKSLHLHAGTTSTAEEIVSALGDLRGMRNAGGMEDVIAAVNSSGKSVPPHQPKNV